MIEEIDFCKSIIKLELIYISFEFFKKNSIQEKRIFIIPFLETFQQITKNIVMKNLQNLYLIKKI